MLLGLSEPSSGQIKIFGAPPQEGHARRKIGYLPDAPLYHKFLSGRELMRFFGKLVGIPKAQREKRAVELLERFGLSDAMDRKLASYSKGMLQRLGFAQALMGDPEVLVLDEPTAGVDPVGAEEVGKYVGSLKEQGKTVLLCSHLLTQVQSICDSVGIMNKGRLLASGKIEGLLDSPSGGRLAIDGLGEADQAELSNLARARGGRPQVVGQNLEELFRSLVDKDNQGGES